MSSAEEQVRGMLRMSEDEFETAVAEASASVARYNEGSRELDFIGVQLNPEGGTVEIGADFRFVAVVDGTAYFARASKTDAEVRAEAVRNVYELSMLEQQNTMAEMMANLPSEQERFVDEDDEGEADG